MEVPTITDETEELVLDMIDAMKNYGGVGISAPQLGEAVRVIVFKAESTEEKILINPQILSKSSETIKSVEGCLSLPGIVIEVERPSWVEVQYTDIENNQHIEKFEDVNACVFSHEYDHLQGQLLTFYMSPIQKSLMDKKLRSIRKFNKLTKRLSALDKQKKS